MCYAKASYYATSVLRPVQYGLAAYEQLSYESVRRTVEYCLACRLSSYACDTRCLVLRAVSLRDESAMRSAVLPCRMPHAVCRRHGRINGISGTNCTETCLRAFDFAAYPRRVCERRSAYCGRDWTTLGADPPPFGLSCEIKCKIKYARNHMYTCVLVYYKVCTEMVASGI